MSVDWSEVYEATYADLVRFLHRKVWDAERAQELAQETFVRALRRIGSVTYQGRDIGAWFVTIAKNLIVDHVRSGRYRWEQAHGDVLDVPSSYGPEQQVLAGAAREELLRCIGELSSDQRECITLRFLRGLSVAETAVLMDRQVGAVRVLQHRAVRRLAQLLDGLR